MNSLSRVCELLQKGDITKEDLKFYYSKGSSDALILLFLGMTMPKSSYSIEHFWDEETNEILFVTRMMDFQEENIFTADDKEIKEITDCVVDLIKMNHVNLSNPYRDILARETDNLEILQAYAEVGDEEARKWYEFLCSNSNEQHIN